MHLRSLPTYPPHSQSRRCPAIPTNFCSGFAIIDSTPCVRPAVVKAVGFLRCFSGSRHGIPSYNTKPEVVDCVPLEIPANLIEAKSQCCSFAGLANAIGYSVSDCTCCLKSTYRYNLDSYSHLLECRSRSAYCQPACLTSQYLLLYRSVPVTSPNNPIGSLHPTGPAPQ